MTKIMASPYTEIVANSDNCTLSQFAMRCARDFIPLLDIPLDAPIPERISPNEHYREEYEAAKEAYDAFIASPPTEEELSRSYDAYVASEKERHANVIVSKRLMRRRYNRMLSKVLGLRRG